MRVCFKCGNPFINDPEKERELCPDCAFYERA